MPVRETSTASLTNDRSFQFATADVGSKPPPYKTDRNIYNIVVSGSGTSDVTPSPVTTIDLIPSMRTIPVRTGKFIRKASLIRYTVFSLTINTSILFQNVPTGRFAPSLKIGFPGFKIFETLKIISKVIFIFYL